MLFLFRSITVFHLFTNLFTKQQMACFIQSRPVQRFHEVRCILSCWYCFGFVVLLLDFPFTLSIEYTFGYVHVYLNYYRRQTELPKIVLMSAVYETGSAITATIVAHRIETPKNNIHTARYQILSFSCEKPIRYEKCVVLKGLKFYCYAVWFAIDEYLPLQHMFYYLENMNRFSARRA